jgi:hypothetical protein
MRLPIFSALAPFLVALRDATRGAVVAAVLARGGRRLRRPRRRLGPGRSVPLQRAAAESRALAHG